jgi:hypothetical protein
MARQFILKMKNLLDQWKRDIDNPSKEPLHTWPPAETLDECLDILKISFRASNEGLLVADNSRSGLTMGVGVTGGAKKTGKSHARVRSREGSATRGVTLATLRKNVVVFQGPKVYHMEMMVENLNCQPRRRSERQWRTRVKKRANRGRPGGSDGEEATKGLQGRIKSATA